MCRLESACFLYMDATGEQANEAPIHSPVSLWKTTRRAGVNNWSACMGMGCMRGNLIRRIRLSISPLGCTPVNGPPASALHNGKAGVILSSDLFIYFLRYHDGAQRATSWWELFQHLQQWNSQCYAGTTIQPGFA